MRSTQIQNLIAQVEKIYGPITLYGSQEDEQLGTCFFLENISATFSVLTLDGKMPKDTFSIQVEGRPPGDYIYTDDLSLDDFLKIISIYKKPNDDWPQ